MSIIDIFGQLGYFGTMNIHLTDHFEQFIENKLKSGQYSSASEVVRDALRLLEEQDKLKAVRLEALREEIRKGLESGGTVPFDAEAIKKKARERQQSRKG
ncbi:MAG: type II toxin-antitoxin system ParD family antitoxin [Meiothermus sp.]|nr:type II toxin-antitoxin system ParD family antitoxin [Meiothermus sp.]